MPSRPPLFSEYLDWKEDKLLPSPVQSSLCPANSVGSGADNHGRGESLAGMAFFMNKGNNSTEYKSLFKQFGGKK
jgi:hypothetical protein